MTDHQGKSNQSQTMEVNLYSSGNAYVHVLGKGILKRGGLSETNRRTRFHLAAPGGTYIPETQRPPEWVLDLLDTIPALALISAQAREAAA